MPKKSRPRPLPASAPLSPPVRPVSRAAAAIYESVLAGQITERHAAVYGRELRQLEKAGLVVIRGGHYAAIDGAKHAPVAPVEIMIEKSIRLSTAMLTALDAEATANEAHDNVSAVMRRALELGLPQVAAERRRASR